MSDNDDPFGRRDRTIIRPNPGGRRPASPPPAPAPQGGAPPASAPLPPVSYPSQPGPATSSGEWDAWMNAARGAGPSPYLQASAASAPMTPAPATPHISVDLGTVTANPLMRAAASLLLLIGRLRAGLSRGAPAQLMDQVAQAIQQFEADARAAGAPGDQVAAAKYALAATADDIVQNLPGEGGGVWTQYSMLVRFFAERTGGVKFFQELERAKQQPAVNLGLLELMHACLSLGFEGVYRTGGGAGAVQGVRRDLYETIRRAAPRRDDDLSPHWRGQTIALAGRRFQMPAWSIAAVAAAILFAVYLVLRNMLIGQAEALALLAAAAHPAGEVDIAREAYVPPPPPLKPHVSTQLERIRAALADEILAGKVSADQTATSIFVRIGSVVLFPKGGAQVNDSFAPIAKKIAASLDKEPGEIRIDGYTDSDPITTVAFASNFELSQARAKSVAAMLKPSLAHPDRIVVAGKGTANPVAPNDNEADKTKNRRVEISIPRAD